MEKAVFFAGLVVDWALLIEIGEGLLRLRAGVTDVNVWLRWLLVVVG